MLAIYEGVVGSGLQVASGRSVGRDHNPYPASSLKMQDGYFRKQAIDLAGLVPGLVWGTINLKMDRELALGRPDHKAHSVDWTEKLTGEARIAPETFSFIHCCFVYPLDGAAGCTAYYPGLIYYPHPETKPSIHAHRFDVLEVLTSAVANLAHGTPASLVCRADAFTLRERKPGGRSHSASPPSRGRGSRGR